MFRASRSFCFVAALGACLVYSAAAQTVRFDFDTGSPVLVDRQNLPVAQTAGGITAVFNSPVRSAFSIQSDATTGWHMSQFSGHYVYANLPNAALDITFTQPVTAITFTFATADFQQNEVPTTLQVAAYMNAKTNPVGAATGHGTYGTDTMPMGTLTFTSNGQPFTLVEITIPPAPLAAGAFFVDNVVVTPGGLAAPVLTAPSNGAAGVLTAPVLSWNAVSGATSYDVYFGTLTTPPLVTNTTATTYSTGTLSQNTTYHWQIVAKNSTDSASSAIWSFTTGGPVSGLHFVPVTPCRVVDTRGAAGSFGGPSMAANSERSFTIPQSACGIPTTAAAYSLNVTVVPPGPLSYLTLWPSGQARPTVSTLNSFNGDVVANAAIVPAGAGGAVSVYVTHATDVILDINGYFDTSTGSNSYAFFPAAPCRIADTRMPTGMFGGPMMGAGESRDYPVPSSSCGIPSTAGGYSLNVTVVPEPTLHFLAYLTTWPAGQPRPNVSTLNSWNGQVVANAAIVPSGANGSVSVFAANPTDTILDINGYFAPSGSQGALLFYPVTPCRIADTRNAVGPFGGPTMTSNTSRTFAIPASSCYVPTTAAAYSINVTVVPQGPLAYLTTWPAGSLQPGVSTLNSWDARIVANAAIVPAGAGAGISVFVTNTTDVILDINGYFAP